MSARIFFLCLFFSIISTGASLTCQSCFASWEECKNENMKRMECRPDEGHCLTLSFRSTLISPPVSFTYKSCAKANQSSKDYYGLTSLAKKYQQMRLAYCANDVCNTAPLPIPGRDLMKPNGFICPGSYEENGFSAEKGPVLCLGDETQCITVKFSTHALSSFYSTATVQGCSTKSVCTYPTGDTEQAHGLLRFRVEKIECSNPEGLEGWNGFSRTFGWGWN